MKHNKETLALLGKVDLRVKELTLRSNDPELVEILSDIHKILEDILSEKTKYG